MPQSKCGALPFGDIPKLTIGVTSRQGGCLYNHPNVLNGDASQVATHSSTSFHAIVHPYKVVLASNPETSSKSNAMDLEGLEPTTNRL